MNGAGGSIITVEGGAVLHGCTHRVIGDRIVCATYLCAAAAAGGEAPAHPAWTTARCPPWRSRSPRAAAR